MSIGSHQATVGKSQVHLTPKWLIESLGHFDLDPCAADPRPWDCAAKNITAAEDGLTTPWQGRVWLNPPFNRYVIADWICRLADHGNGIALVHARTETAWFEAVWNSAKSLLFLADRVIFCKPDGTPQTISNPSSKHYGKPANSGAPVVLAAFSDADTKALEGRGLAGRLVTNWSKNNRFAFLSVSRSRAAA